MPSNKQRIIGAAASIAITVGGAWLASTAHSKSTIEAITAFENGINITFSGIRNDTGNVIVMVFADRDAFKAYDVTKAVGYKEIPAYSGNLSAQFPELKSGPYAIAAFHDEDGNQDLNMDGGLPTEGYATSGALDAYDIPTFASASLKGDNTIITMHYVN